MPGKPRGGRPRKLPKTLLLRLGTMDEARESLTELLNTYARDELPETKARTLIYGIRAAVDIIAAQREGELEKRLATIEERMRDLSYAAIA